MPQIIVELTQAQVDKMIADGSVIYPAESPGELQARVDASATDGVWRLATQWAGRRYDIENQAGRDAAIAEHEQLFPGTVAFEGDPQGT